MTITFTHHAAIRLQQRARMNVGSGKSFVKKALINPIVDDEIMKYQLKNNDETTTIVCYKHLMFVIRKDEDKEKIYVITVMVKHK